MKEFTADIGMETLSAEGGKCVVELELQGRHMSMAQRAHGGVLFTLLDTAMGRCIITKLPEGRGCATINAQINYFRPIQQGRIRAEAECLRMTRRTAYAEGILVDEEGNVLARSTGTFFLTETRVQGDRERV